MSLKLVTLSGLLAFSKLVLATGAATEVAASAPTSGTDTVHGCYSNIDGLTFNGTYEFNAQGKCAGYCRDLGLYVGASNAQDCYCGSEYPALNTLVDDSECTEPCPGFGQEACGGADTYTVYNTGVRVTVKNADNITDTSSSSSSSSTAASSTTSKAAVSTSAGVIVTVTPTETASSNSGSGSSKTVGIAVGVVVGVVAVAAIAGAGIFVTRRRRNREIEEEHRRNAAVNAFISGGKPPSSSGGLSLSDQRLDPVMAQRRMSSGSIADEADYSRRILRVTNA
ncbi:hypothetical protein BKA67DRAFT_536924 [Truncatella angustata]|uniref:WSC domain-containing protein n=1 Tax=Truncatella angustata TaxID=152316 RepID=A0A9P8ZWS9_9PEZI|nr:uncharacterized protein BKA67DRAFT_536924 [Truncatella angustata]KAH6653237.1 hypothetical protein BKA67DRAFT_536924 [Truncatella angustata]KAH8198924.1 hypothetical protein TruAng_006885 [Truncatella angustata]